MQRTLRSLRHLNFRLYYLGQLVSLNGTWMQHLVQAWLLYRLTGSSLMLGVAGAAALLPNLLFGLYGWVLADRLPRRELLMAGQVVAMVQAFTLGILTLGGWVTPAHIIALAFLLGVVQALEMPARHSLVAQLVPREDLPNAIALNSSLFHLARFVGPGMAGVLVARVGEGIVFLLNGLTFVVVLLALRAVRLPARPEGHEVGTADLCAGLRYAWGESTIRAALGMVAAASLFGASSAVLMPVFAAEVFGSGPKSLGWLLGALGGGAFVGALTLARRGTVTGLERLIAVMGLIASAALLAFSATRTLALALLILPVAGYAMTTLIASSNAYIQLAVPDRLRGRTMALFALALHGAMPLGHLAVGASAEVIGAPYTVAACSVALFVMATAFGWGVRQARTA